MAKQKEDNVQWGTWECPVCGDVCQDPETVSSTQCHNGHGVYLSRVNDDGYMEAFEQAN